MNLNELWKNKNFEDEVTFDSLTSSIIEFLDKYSTLRLVGKEFSKIVGPENGEIKFLNILKATGFKNESKAFFIEILNIVFNKEKSIVRINNIILPKLFLTAILNIVIPGSDCFSVKNINQLKRCTTKKINKKNYNFLKDVIEKYPVRLSMHVVRQIMISEQVAYQYLPFINEIDKTGHSDTWVGQFQDGLIEQMYRNRVIFLLSNSCPVYCRFCFRKHKNSRNEKSPTRKDVLLAIQYVESSILIKEILITGGDPFLKKNNLILCIDELMKIDHVQSIRLATRSISYYPQLFNKKNFSYIQLLIKKNIELQFLKKRLEIATHFIHPDEISIESLDVISKFVNSGIKVYIQTPFLKNCNDKGPELVKLFNILRGAGAEFHYIFIPCSPIYGNSMYWTPLSKGINIAKYLRANLSDRAVPKICTATPIGKLDWHTSGWAVEKVKDKQGFLWIRTPYTPEFFKKFAPNTLKLDSIRLNKEGTYDIQYMAEIGEDVYFKGPRPKKPASKLNTVAIEDINLYKNKFLAKKDPGISIVKTNAPGLYRTHLTRVELTDLFHQETIDYIAKDNRISDVTIFLNNNLSVSLPNISTIIDKLKNIYHVNAVRIKNSKFNSSPCFYDDSIINKLGKLNKLTIANPLRLEIETWFLTADEINENHATITRKLNNIGITVYNNTPLLSFINDCPEKISKLAFSLRETGIEFHHIYVAGLSGQNNWNSMYPVNFDKIIDVASLLRREGSGREIPKYVIQTILGEVDFGLTSSFINSDKGQLKIKLDCYDISYYKKLDRCHIFPKNVSFVKDIPVLNIEGLEKTSGFFI